MKKSLLEKSSFSIIAVIVAFILTRFLYLEDLFSFGLDEEYQVLIGHALVKNFHIRWIGVNAGNIGFYLGPGFSYITWILLSISRNPFLLSIFPPIVGLITLSVLYLVTSSFFNKSSALIATVLYTLTPFFIVYDRKYWNPLFVPLMSLLFIYTLVRVKENYHYWLLIGALIGLLFHIHLSLLVFIPTIIIVWIYLLIKSISKIKQFMLYSLGGFCAGLIVGLPLIIFDFLHQFSNIKALIALFSNSSKTGRIFSGFHVLLSLFRPEYSYITVHYVVYILINIGVAGLFLLACWKWGQTKDYKQTILVLIITMYILSIVVYAERMRDYYMLGFFPVLFIFIAGAVRNISTQGLQRVIVPLLLVWTPFVVFQQTKGNIYGLKHKKAVIQSIASSKILGNEPYRLVALPDYGTNPGWRYLFEIYYRPPISSNADNTFGWIYQNNKTDEDPEYKVIVTYEQLEDFQRKSIDSFQQGGYYAYLLGE